MKTRRLLGTAGAGIACGVVVVIAMSAYWERKEKPFTSAPRFLSALKAFSRDQTSSGRRPPPEVSAEQLVRGGYLSTNDISSFGVMGLTFNTQADDSNPQIVLAHACTPDGQFICLLADGSVQQVSRSRYQQMFPNSGQQSGPGD